MTSTTRPSPAEIRDFRRDNPKMRERDIAAQLGISEAALVAAETGLTVVRIDGDANRLLERAASLGEVMVLTRNESAVHEKIGLFEKVSTGKHASIVLGENVDLRIFPGAWAHGFAVTKTDGEDVRRSLQFFDKAGNAVHKIHLRPASNLDAYQAIVDDFRLEDQSQEFVELAKEDKGEDYNPVDVDALRENWSAMTDTHQFFGMLKKLKIARQDAVRSVGEDFAWQVRADAVGDMMNAAAERDTDIMCFVGNNGAIQIHSGKVKNIKPMGPWLNVMDPTFHLHLRTDHIAECWVVRKPTVDGHVTSLEVYDARGEMIIQFFSKRKEGMVERTDWREILENLARPGTVAA